MSLEKENEILRLKLEKITKSKEPIPQQIRRIESLGIPFITEPSSWKSKRHQTLNINCFAFALGLGESDNYRDCAFDDAIKETHLFFAGPSFIQFLFANTIIQPTPHPPERALVIYFDAEDNPTHAGILIDIKGKVRSKWGTLAIFEHDLWAIPKQYGIEIGYYKNLDTTKAEVCFFEYVELLKRTN